MANILDYLDWRGDLTLAERGFNEVDNLLMAELCFLDFSGIVPADFSAPVSLPEAMQKYDAARPQETMGVLVPEQIPELGHKMAASRRFSDLTLCAYVSRTDEETQTQFSALTALLPDKTAYIAFRGTDDTIVGWKEDFNLSFSKDIPSQHSALRYAEQIARISRGTLILGGHSKGGNLAVYAAMNLPGEVRSRILRVYNHDGPGFPSEVFDSPAYRSISSLIHKTIPQTAIIGLMLEQHESYFVVASNAFTLFQHDPFSWIVRDGSFVYIKDVDNFSKYTNRTLNAWLNELDIDTRKTFVDALYSILEHTDAVTFYDLTTNWRRSLKTIYEAVRDTDPSVRRVISQTIGALIRASAEEMKDLVHEQVLLLKDKMQNEE